MTDYIFNEPKDYAFQDRNGHSGKVYKTCSKHTDYLIIECQEKLTCSFVERVSERSYVVLEGKGYFLFNNEEKQAVAQGDIVVIPAGTRYSFGGTLKMLLLDVPRWSNDQEEIYPEAHDE